MTKTITPKAINDIDRQVGERIRAARLAAGLSQEKLGAALGVTFQQVQKYEKGTNRVGPSRLMKIAEVTGTDAARLLGCNDVTPAPVTTMMTTREGQALAAAFNYIASDDDRRALVTIAGRMAHFSKFYRSTIGGRAVSLQAAE